VSLIDFFRRRRTTPTAEERDAIMKAFRQRYTHFKDLLQSNSELGRIMSDMEQTLTGHSLFGMNYIRSQATRAVFHTMRMVTALNAIADDRFSGLVATVESINTRISDILDARAPVRVAEFVLPLAEVNRDVVDWVGGKNANLGEMMNRVGVPVPRGFAITTTAYRAFMDGNGLMEETRKLLRDAFADDPEGLVRVSKAIMRRIDEAVVPDEVVEAMQAGWDATFGPGPVRCALRSSAVSEDGSLSFAGQYRTVLNVTRDELPSAFRSVLASIFSPRVIAYRLHQGVPFEHCAMAMVCLEMVDAVASGVAFSRHPVDLLSDAVVINGIWGLGEYVVDGVVPPDTWLVSRVRPDRVAERSIATKSVRLMPALHGGGTVESPVPPEQRSMPSLTDAQVIALADMALRLEEHYRHPQDMEWALDGAGRLVVLQTRPMRLADARSDNLPASPRIDGAGLLLEGGDVACAGVGCGPVVIPSSAEELAAFPCGGVLVAAHSSPNYVLVMDRAQAIITDAGSVTGHMASLSREFNVPTLLNARDAMRTLRPGQEVTVDAISGRVYEGCVEELLALRRPRQVCLGDTPVHIALRRVADHILPLHLVDPKAATFIPRSCTTLHDVMRLVHEFSYTEMFRLSDTATVAGSVAVELKASVPLDLHVIDLGGGLADVDGPYAYPEQVASAPFGALLEGMLDPEVHVRGPRPIDMGGFLSVMGRHMIEPPNMHTERFGDRSYAIVSDKYMNFSSRVGYHYSILDAYCGATMNKNYITFEFKGGAADEVRRERRVKCIGIILRELGFTIEVQGDRVQARYLKYPPEEIRARLVQLGRLLIVTRQMDMLMTTEAAVQTFADNFLKGDYH